MNTIACWSAADRRDLFNECAARRNLPPAIIEKDFWVCWTLLHVFQIPELNSHLVFKGGTSLSKVYGAIQRFSEDIDLSISETYLGIEAADAETLSKSQRQKRFEKIRTTCESVVPSTILPLLADRFTAILGDPTAASWGLAPLDDDPATLLFRYPSALITVSDYIAPVVRLEIGSGVDPWPNNAHEVTPIAAEEFPDIFETQTAQTICLEIIRTFWEKATILHMLNSRTNPVIGHRMSRHFSNLAQLRSHANLQDPLNSLDMLKRVAEHKDNYFRTSGVNYADCYTGSLRLVPPTDRRAALRTDYGAMRDMFFGDVLPFDEIIESLGELEVLVNSAASDRAGDGG